MTFPAGDVALPTDPAIPALAAIRESGWEAFLSEVGIPGRFQGWELLRHRLGDRCVFRIRVAGSSVAVKVYRSDATGIVELAAALAIHGYASGRPPTIPPVVAHSRQLNAVVTAWLDGQTALDLVASNQGKRAGALAAQWLWAMHGAPIALGRRYDTADVLRDVTRWSGLVAAEHSGLGALAQRLGEALSQAPPSRPLELAHGSMVPRHVLDLGNGPGVIDWDGFRQAAIEFDVGSFLAFLQRMSFRAVLVPGTREAAAAFRTELDGLVDPDALAWYEAVNRLRFAAYLARKRREHWQRRVRALLAPFSGRPI